MPWLLSPRPPDEVLSGSSVSARSASRQMRVPASPSQLHQVRCCADHAAADFGLGADERYQFVFAVNEAVTNAIQHGTPAEDGTIGVRMDIEGDALICSVDDSGTFVRSTEEPNSLAERGRGLTLMGLLMDDVEVLTTVAGTTVRLHKRRTVVADAGRGSA